MWDLITLVKVVDVNTGQILDASELRYMKQDFNDEVTNEIFPPPLRLLPDVSHEIPEPELLLFLYHFNAFNQDWNIWFKAVISSLSKLTME